MNKKSLTALGIAAIVILGAGTAFGADTSAKDKKMAQELAMKKADAAMKRADAMKKADAAMKRADAMKKAKAAKKKTNVVLNTDPAGTAMMVKGSYIAYDPAKIVNAAHGKVVLDFSASWCPICQEADKNFKASATPEGLTLLKVDYDNSTDLKRKYGVTIQHTFVQVDKDGNLLKKWSGTVTYNELLKQTV